MGKIFPYFWGLDLQLIGIEGDDVHNPDVNAVVHANPQ